MSHHPQKGLRPGRGLHYNFFKLLKEKFPNYDERVLKFATRVFTRFRIRTMNIIQRQKDRSKKRREKRKVPKEDEPKKEKKIRKQPITARGKRHLIDRTT